MKQYKTIHLMMPLQSQIHGLLLLLIYLLLNKSFIVVKRLKLYELIITQKLQK